MTKAITLKDWSPDMPEHLSSYDALVQDIRSQLKGLSNSEKGDAFAHFVQELLPQSELNWQFEQPILSSKKSNDGGVDLTAAGRDGAGTLYIQSKQWIDRAEDIDGILTKFQDYLAQNRVSHNGMVSMFELLDEHPAHFLIASLSPLENIRKKYEQHEYGNKSFYLDLVANKRLHFIDGWEILKILQSTYRKVSDSPIRLELNLETPVISKGNVYIGIISSKELKHLYDDFNESLFFENLRGFQGLKSRQGRKLPNIEIVKTITTDPERMLERNNGIVIKASKVELDASKTQLTLTRGSVVNGCQTTTCLVSHPNDISCVLVKIVETEDPWDITEAANLQNYVSDIDMTISRTMRSQLAKRAAASLGFKLDIAKESAFKLLSTVTQREIVYDESRLLYIGLLSRTPNTIFTGNYTDLRQDVAQEFYNEDRYGTLIYEAIFTIQQALHEALPRVKSTFTSKTDVIGIERLYGRNPAYRSFVAILALCATLNEDITKGEQETAADYARLKAFFGKTIRLLNGDKKKFYQFFRLACKVWMDEVMPANRSEDDLRQYMSPDSKRSKFSGMLRTVHRELAVYEQMRKEDLEN